MTATRAHAGSRAIPAGVSIEDVAKFFCTDPIQLDYHSHYCRMILELLLDSAESSQKNVKMSETLWMEESKRSRSKYTSTYAILKAVFLSRLQENE